jgi:ABC-type spermidine/putrescine transport system permease subunit I
MSANAYSMIWFHCYTDPLFLMISVKKMRNMLLLQTGGNKNEMLSITFGISGMPFPYLEKSGFTCEINF